ncbi:MAG: hypothetical protein LIP11_01495 [Clostridiales bacterium]|nr:hypothetical protein [Clostridiales bacterium]
MKGEYLFQVRSKRVRFSFQIRRNITVIFALLPYSKHHLEKYYMTDTCKRQVIKEFPEPIRENLLSALS